MKVKGQDYGELFALGNALTTDVNKDSHSLARASSSLGRIGY